MLVDFHAHTNESDGSLSPAQLAAAMRARGVVRYAVTDHDTTAGYDALAGSAAPPSVTGVEINTSDRGNEVHVLGYGFRLGPSPLADLIARNRVARAHRAETIVGLLRDAGYGLTLDDVRNEAGENAPLGRPHVAKALVRLGLVSSVERAFRTLLGAGCIAHVPQAYVRPREAVAAIVAAGGVPVLAHPGRLRDESPLPELVDSGLLGIEVFYPAHAPAQVAHFRAVAARFGLVMTGGSDFHDVRWTPRGVGMEVATEDLRPFLDLVEIALF